MEICDEYPTKMDNFHVRLNYEYCDRLIGKQLGHDTIKDIAKSLEMNITNEDPDGIDLVVPAYRVDVQRPCDVVEDILRIYGYNNIEIPSELKSSLTIAGESDKNFKRENLVGEQLVGEGFNEIMNNSLTKSSYYDKDELNKYTWAKTVKLMNPLSADLGVMRQTLLFGGLESIIRNINRKAHNLKFFEVGNCYWFDEQKHTAEAPIKAYTQDYHMALWVTGKRVEGSWAHADEDTSVYELKAYVENIFRRVGVPQGMFTEKASDNNIFDKAITVENHGGKVIAEYGIVNHKILKNFDIDQPVFYADIDWQALMKAVKKNKLEFKELSKFPAVSRDLALLVDENVQFAQIEQIARQTEKKLLKRVELFDVYTGDKLPAGKKSYAVNFILQDENKTLNDKAIDAIMKKLIHQLTTKLGAELR